MMFWEEFVFQYTLFVQYLETYKKAEIAMIMFVG